MMSLQRLTRCMRTWPTERGARLERAFDVDLFCVGSRSTRHDNWDTYGAMAHNYYPYGDSIVRDAWIPGTTTWRSVRGREAAASGGRRSRGSRASARQVSLDQPFPGRGGGPSAVVLRTLHETLAASGPHLEYWDTSTLRAIARSPGGARWPHGPGCHGAACASFMHRRRPSP
jgi:hypothetical protein